MKWVSLSMMVVTFLQFLKITIVGRILGPGVFGLLGMVTVVIGLANAFGDMGISNAIIHRQDSTRRQLSSLYWLNIFSGIAVFIIVVIITPLIVDFYEEPAIRLPLYFLSLSFIILPFGLQFKMLLQKNLQFDKIAGSEICNAVISLVVSVILALRNLGVYSLVWGQLAGIMVGTLLYMAYGWRAYRPEFHFQTQDLKGYLSFGLYQMGERMTNYFSANLDYIIIGKFLGAVPLGIYTLAYQLVVVPLVKINPVITNVMFPVFSKMQHDNKRLASGYLKVVSLIAMISFPLLTGLAVVSPIIIPLFWGDKWLGAIPLIQILCVMGILKSLGNCIGSVLLAKGRADIGFKINVVSVMLYLCAFFYMVRLGVIYIAIAHVIIPILLLPVFLLILNRQIGLKASEFFSVLARPFAGSIIMTLSMHAVYGPLSVATSKKPVVLGLIILLGSAVFIGYNYIFNKDFLKEIIHTVKLKGETA